MRRNWAGVSSMRPVYPVVLTGPRAFSTESFTHRHPREACPRAGGGRGSSVFGACRSTTKTLDSRLRGNDGNARTDTGNALEPRFAAGLADSPTPSQVGGRPSPACGGRNRSARRLLQRLRRRDHRLDGDTEVLV